jgi:hypothetical protein
MAGWQAVADEAPADNAVSRSAASTTVTRISAGYLGAQAILGIVLWVGLAASSTARSWFELVPGRRAVTDGFRFADLGLIVIGSALGAWALASNRPWATPAVWFTAGAVMYPTVFLIGWVSFTRGVGVVGLAVMVPVSTFTCWVAYQTWRTGNA